MIPQSKHPVFWSRPHLKVGCATVVRQCLQIHDIVLTRLDIEDHLHPLLPEWYQGVQPSEIEIIFDEILRNLAEILVSW